MSADYEYFGTLVDGVPLVLPPDGMAFPECMFSGLTVQNGVGNEATIEFDYATSAANNLQDLGTVTTNSNYVSPFLKSVQLSNNTGADFLIRFVCHTRIGT